MGHNPSFIKPGNAITEYLASAAAARHYDGPLKLPTYSQQWREELDQIDFEQSWWWDSEQRCRREGDLDTAAKCHENYQKACAKACSVSTQGRPPRSHDLSLIENILQWMRGRLRQGDSVVELTEESYVLYQWPDRYGNEDDLPEGHPVHLWQAIRDGKSRGRAAKRSVQSGIRWFRNYLKPTGYIWAELQKQALED